jgi:hypothetical protein
MELAITIAPHNDGWTLNAPDLDLHQDFTSGREAETRGRDLAGRLARTGYDARLEIILRDGSLAATIPYRAALAA